MAHENKIKEYAQQAGYQPLEGRCILVRPAPDNLSEKIFSFFKSFMECDMCVLQMCGNELIFLPFHRAWGSLRKDVSLVLPYGEIQSVALEDDLLNTIITIRTDDDEIRLTTQQAALSDLVTASGPRAHAAGGNNTAHP